MVRTVSGEMREPIDTVSKLTKSAYLYKLLDRAEEATGVRIPEGVSFHFRHTYGAWMRRLDTAGLVSTGAWTSRAGAASYGSDLLPGNCVKSVLKLINEA